MPAATAAVPVMFTRYTAGPHDHPPRVVLARVPSPDALVLAGRHSPVPRPARPARGAPDRRRGDAAARRGGRRQVRLRLVPQHAARRRPPRRRSHPGLGGRHGDADLRRGDGARGLPPRLRDGRRGRRRVVVRRRAPPGNPAEPGPEVRARQRHRCADEDTGRHAAARAASTRRRDDARVGERPGERDREQRTGRRAHHRRRRVGRRGRPTPRRGGHRRALPGAGRLARSDGVPRRRARLGAHGPQAVVGQPQHPRAARRLSRSTTPIRTSRR